jgi:hypothetical protein
MDPKADESLFVVLSLRRWLPPGVAWLIAFRRFRTFEQTPLQPNTAGRRGGRLRSNKHLYPESLCGVTGNLVQGVAPAGEKMPKERGIGAAGEH